MKILLASVMFMIAGVTAAYSIKTCVQAGRVIRRNERILRMSRGADVQERKNNMAKFELAWVETGKPSRELALEYGMRRICIIPDGTDQRILEKLVEAANTAIERGVYWHEI